MSEKDDFDAVRDGIGVDTGTSSGDEEAVAAAHAALDRLETQDERLHKAYGRLAERLRLATPRSLMEVSDDPQECPTCHHDRLSPLVAGGVFCPDPIHAFVNGETITPSTQETDPE